jgi:hypothetical protein
MILAMAADGAFQVSFGPHAVKDIPNYTNSEPILQISEVKL